MNLNDILKPDFQPLILAALAWAWLFVLAPARAFRAGIELEDPPLFFKMSTFKLIRLVALGLLLAGAWGLKDDLLARLSLDEITNRLASGALVGLLVGAGLTVALLFAVPEMTARGRIRRQEEPGEWKTPLLVLYRWVWLGLTVAAGLGLSEMIDIPFDLAAGIAMPVLGALVYLLWWGLPAMLVARRAEDDDALAIASLSRVRWLGLPAWIGYLVKGIGRPKEAPRPGTQKLCPTCMRPIDNIDQYDSLRFDICPQCGEMVPPAFSLEDYIRHHALRVKELAQIKHGKRIGRKQGKHEGDLIQRILRALLTLAVRERATDVHLVTESESFLVRGRTDGIMFTLVDLPEEVFRPLVSAIKVQCNMDIAERRKPQDGSFKTAVDDLKLDVRVNTSPSNTGETASLRLLYRQDVLGSIEKLGLARRNHRLLNEYIVRPHGMVLVTGPTGSGKSTTLYNVLQTIADGKRNIITLEDPVEYKIEGINQMQIDPAKNFTFASGLRSILRQDPDVIMVGEIRDEETAKMAIDAAMTGHLVFSTLHTIDTATTVARLLDLGVDPHRHADALALIVSQRLVRLICEKCRESYELATEQLDALGLPGGPEKLILKRGTGCPHCHHTGYFGREAIFEMMAPDGQLRALIGAKVTPGEIRSEARRLGMRTLLEDGLTKAMLGRTTIDEVLRVTN